MTSHSTYPSSYTATSDFGYYDHMSKAETLEQVERLSRWLDTAFRVPLINYRVGWDTIIGLVPGVGDAATAGLSGYIVYKAYKLGVSYWTLARMVMNVIIDTLVGAIPFLGDFFDATFKANRKNVELLRRDMDRWA